jgi:hypothetical protein
MVSTSTRLTPREGVAVNKLLWVGSLTIVVGTLVNLVVRTLAVSFFGVASSFVYLQPPVVIGTTVVFLLLALLAFVLVGHASRHPVRIFRIVAGVALLISFLNPLLLLAGWWLPAAGMNLSIFWTMIVMHIVSALIAVSLLTTLAVERVQFDEHDCLEKPIRRDRNEPDVLEAHENQEKRTSQPSSDRNQ